MPTSRGPAPELPVLHFADAGAWETWLQEHHDRAPGVWLRIFRKGQDTPSVSYAQALDVALCHGWIDSQKRSHDAVSWVQRFTPRGPRSLWSRVNREKVDALAAAGRMRPAGLAAVEAARADGRWDAAYEPQRTATVPPELQAALDASPAAAACFAALGAAARYSVLFRVQTARRPETRARRIAALVEALARGESPR